MNTVADWRRCPQDTFSINSLIRGVDDISVFIRRINPTARDSFVAPRFDFFKAVLF